MTAALAIDVTGLTKSFSGRKVVNDFAIQVPRGQVWGFLGPNGSGKTTTIRMLCGLLLPDSGSGSCLGYDIIRETEQIKRNVGYMTQRFSFYEDLSIRENLDFVARVYEMKDRRAAVDAAIERLGLTQRQNQLAGQLSGGWKQRLALAACILHRQLHDVARYDDRALAEREGLRHHNGARATFFAGAYLHDGLHEGAVRSALAVADRLGGRTLALPSRRA